MLISLKSRTLVSSNSNDDLGASVRSPFSKNIQDLFKHYIAPCWTSSRKSYASVQLSDQLLKTLNQKSPLLRTVKSLLSSKNAQRHVDKQSNKELAVQLIKKSVVQLTLLGKALSLKELECFAYQLLQDEFTDLYPTPEGRADQKKIKQYIRKAAPSALKWLAKNSEALDVAHPSIPQNEGMLREANQGLGLDIQYALELNLPGNKTLSKSELNTAVQEGLVSIPFVMQDGTEIQISMASLQGKTKDWVKNTLPVLLKNLEDNIRNDVQKIRNYPMILKDHSDWDDVIQNYNLPSQLMDIFSDPMRSQLGGDYPEIVRQVSQKVLTAPENYRVVYTTKNDQVVELRGSTVKARGKEWRTNTFQKEAESLENEITTALLKLSEEDFVQSDKPRSYKEIRNTLIVEFQTKNELANAYPELLDAILDSAFAKKEAVDGARLFYNIGFQVLPIHFNGGYLKKGEHFQNTRVKAASGKVYELLNTLTEADAKELRAQHGMEKQGKTVLGEGAFGRVRLAREVSTGDMLAVKKFRPNEQSGKNETELPENLANAEIGTFQLVDERLAADLGPTGAETLSSMRDFAHVGIFVPKVVAHSPMRSPMRKMLSPLRKSAGESSSNQAKKLVGKSYIFMDLANQGDGHEEIARINKIRSKGNMPEAYRRCIHVAVQYAQAVADMHKLLLTHRDIKPANFLHTKDPKTGVERAKLSDFGFVLDDASHNRYAGRTLAYSPPEARDDAHINYYAPAHDAFSLGIVLFNLRNAALGDSPLDIRFVDEESGLSLNVVRKTGINLDKVSLQENHLDSLIAELLNKSVNSRISPQDAYLKLQEIQKKLPK